MKKSWLGVSVLGCGLVFALGLFAYVVDHVRASARVVPGLGEAADPERDQALVLPEQPGDDLESSRVAQLVDTPRPSGLVVHVTPEDGETIRFAEVLAYRGEELLRADQALSGIASLIPFDGPASLRVEIGGDEAARLDVADGHGRFEIVVPRGASVAGMVRMDGVPRADVGLALRRGSGGWLESEIENGLASLGLGQGSPWRYERSQADGSFRFDHLTRDWSGVLHLSDADHHYCFVDGARRVELALPDEALVLELETLHPEPVIRGRVVLHGEPVPSALWIMDQLAESSGNRDTGRCDALGRFTLPGWAADRTRTLRLEFHQPGVGERLLELTGAEIKADLGDVELVPTRALAFVVRSRSGEPIAGARASPRGEPSKLQGKQWFPPPRVLGSDPTNAEGRGLLHLRPAERTLIVHARGYALTDVTLPEGLVGPLEIVLPRSAAFRVAVRDRTGRVPPGMHVRLLAQEAPFAWRTGYGAEQEELLDELLGAGGWGLRAGGYSGDFSLDERGRAWIEPLRAGLPVELQASDDYGSVLASARDLVLEPEEWRPIELRVEGEPRTLLVVARDTLGNRLAGVELKVIPRGLPDPLLGQLRTDRAGMARTEALYSGDVSLRASREGYEPRILEHVAVPREGATVQIRLAHDWWPW